MSSLVLDLQNEILNTNCNVIDVLRRAHLIAYKLNLTEFDEWIANELNGYKSNKKAPKYRKVRGVLKGLNMVHGWQPVIIENPELENTLCEHTLLNPISELVSLISNTTNDVSITFSGNKQEMLNEMVSIGFSTHFKLQISHSAVESIIEIVKNTILEWTLKLEREGVVGEDMRFNEKEKESAQNIQQTIHNYFGETNVINGNTDKMQFVTGNNNNISFVSYNVSKLIDDVKNSIGNEKISDEDKSTAMEIISDIDEKVYNQKSSGIIKSSLIGLAHFLKDTGANTTAMLIFDKIKDYF